MVEMNDAFSAAIDSPARFCFVVTKAGKPKSACLPRLIMGMEHPPTLGHFGPVDKLPVISKGAASKKKDTLRCHFKVKVLIEDEGAVLV